MELKVGDRVRNKINGKIGVIKEILDNKDVNEKYGTYIYNYRIKYDEDKIMTVFNSIVEIEKIKDILDKDEIEYLTNVIKPFKNRVSNIRKINDGIDECIVIEVRNHRKCYSEIIILPYFEKGTMYKRIETHKKYTLKELNLD